MLDILQALLAFAVTMLGLATIVTILMEATWRVIGRRRRLFRHMLKLVYRTEIAPVFDTRVSNLIDALPTTDRYRQFASQYQDAKTELEAASNRIQRWRATLAVKSAESELEKLPTSVSKELDVEGPFLKEIVNSPFRPHEASWIGNHPSRVARLLSRIFIWLFSMNQTQEMDLEEFMRRFARSNAGQTFLADLDAAETGGDRIQLEKLEKQLESELDTQKRSDLEKRVLALKKQIEVASSGAIQHALDKLALRFDEMADASQEYFKNSSAAISLIVGIGVAIVLNVDGYRILTHFVHNPEVARTVAERAPEVLQENEKARQRLADAEERISQALRSNPEQQSVTRQNDRRTVANGTGQTAPQSSGSTDTALKQEMEVALKELGDARKGYADAAIYAENVKKLGIPMGVDFFPHCYWLGVKSVIGSHPDGARPESICRGVDREYFGDCSDSELKPESCLDIAIFSRCQDWDAFCQEVYFGGSDDESLLHQFMPDWGEFFRWLFSVFLTGMLIGLGGPFWYDAVTGLMKASQVLRGRSPAPDEPGSKEDGKATPNTERDESKLRAERFLAHASTST